MRHRDLAGRLLLEPTRPPDEAAGPASTQVCLRWPVPPRGPLLTRLLALLLGLFIPAALSVAVVPDEFDALLRRADDVKSADPRAFRAMLERMEQLTSAASQVQLEQLRYLQIYRMSLDGQFPQAIAALRELATEATDVSTRFRATAFLANNYAGTRDFAAGLDALNQALAMLPAIEDTNIRHQGYLAAAILYNQAGQYDLALRYVDTTLGEPASGRSRCIAGIMRLEALFALGRLPSDARGLDGSVEECERHGEQLLSEFVRGFQARVLFNGGDAAAAARLLESRLDAVASSEYPRLIAEHHALLAEARLALGDAAAARRHAQRAIDASEGVEFSLPLVTAFRVLSREAEMRGDAASALAHHRRWAAVDRAYIDDIKARELAYQLAQHDSLQKTHTIELLNQRNKLLELESEVNKQAANNNRLAIAMLVVLLASIALWAYLTKREQLRFRRLAQTDALTGISNRLYFSERAPQILEECAQRGRPAALVMFDLDAFKSINDRHGHACGDWVLAEVARRVSALCGEGDLFARLGGEEFAILRAGADVETALVLANRCREAISSIDTSLAGPRFSVSASFGVAMAAPSPGGSLDALLIHADIALYCAKSEGRNRVSVHGVAECPRSPDATPANSPSPPAKA
jgi:diguanylate cyclase (GGDEF)-like protein